MPSMARIFTLGVVSLVLAASVASGCSSDDENEGSQSQSQKKTCADLQACCDKVADAEKRKNCQVVVDALKGQENADLGCDTAYESGWKKECP
jgi:hypothetical protein